MRWRPRRYAQGLSQDSTIEGQPRTASVGGEVVSHVDEFFGRIPCRRPSADQDWIAHTRITSRVNTPIKPSMRRLATPDRTKAWP